MVRAKLSVTGLHVAQRPQCVDGGGPLSGPRWRPRLAALRNLVLPLIRSRGLSVREARENFREDRAEAIALVTGRILWMALATAACEPR